MNQQSGSDSKRVKLEELDIWGEKPPEPWVRAAAARWADLIERVARLFNDLFALSTLPQAETQLLALLWREPGTAEPAMLADRLRVSRQSMTGLLDKLEAGRYIVRARHPTDRRRTVVRLRPKGLSFVRGFAAAVLGRQTALFQRRSKAEVDATLSAFESILDLAAKWTATASPATRGDE